MKNFRYQRWMIAVLALAIILLNAACTNIKHPNGTYTNDSSGVITTIVFKGGTMSAKNNLGAQTYKWEMVCETEISLTRTSDGQITMIEYNPDSDVVTLEGKQYTK